MCRLLAVAALLTMTLAVRTQAADNENPGQVQDRVRPNVVLVITDDQRYDTLGCTGHPVVQTPHIDRLAHEGALFRRFYVATPLCSPSRGSYLTGLYAHRHGVINNDKLGLDVISHALMTFPRQLRAAGYETAFIGKWHMGLDDSRRPGFDRWFSFKGQGAYIDGVANDDGNQRQLDGNMTDHINQQAVAWLTRPHAKPFCLIVSHKAVHAPYLPAPRLDALYREYTFVPPKVADSDRAGKPAMIRKILPRTESSTSKGWLPSRASRDAAEAPTRPVWSATSSAA